MPCGGRNRGIQPETNPRKCLWFACFFLLGTGSAVRLEAGGKKLLPWQRWLVIPSETRPLPELVNGKWYSSGGKEGTLAVSGVKGPWGGSFFRFTVKIDHFNKGRYPLGWPSFQWPMKEPLNFKSWDAIRYRIRVRSKLDRPFPLRFIVHTGGRGIINERIHKPRKDEWTVAQHDLKGKPRLDNVTLLHFFLSENEYKHGDEMTFEIGGFELVRFKKQQSSLPKDEAALGLWLGERADTSDEVIFLNPSRKSLPALLVFETGADCLLRSDDDLSVRFHEVFTRKETSVGLKLGQLCPAGVVRRSSKAIALPPLEPGYYLVTADLRRKGVSLLHGRVGCDDVYVKAPGESMASSILSVRTGMSLWIRDLLHGDLMCRAQVALPHTYDPLSRATYPEFIRAFALRTGKHTEGNEAGDTGLVYAAEAFRKCGALARCRFTEWLLQDSLDHMVTRMQAPNGATITWSNELADADIGKGGTSHAFGYYDSNQIGEWITPFARAIIYYANVTKNPEAARRLSEPARKAADYLAAHSVQPSGDFQHVLRHLRLKEKPGGAVEQITYYQEKRQCDVYLGRALSGLSYYAYARQLIGEEVPEQYWKIFDDTVKWCARKMKPNGWFDWQCGDVVEGGCHTFLGNIYVGEGLFGCYLADRQARRGAEAKAARAAALKAYHYVTDHCIIRGRKYEYPLEFWVGPYIYWLFTEYQAAAGPDPRLQDWLDTLERKWSQERHWRDFVQRGGPGLVGRTHTNGMLETAILAYPAIRAMRELGKPFRYPPFPE